MNFWFLMQEEQTPHESSACRFSHCINCASASDSARPPFPSGPGNIMAWGTLPDCTMPISLFFISCCPTTSLNCITVLFYVQWHLISHPKAAQVKEGKH